MTTSQVNTAKAKENFTEIVNRVITNHERIVLTRRGKEVAAIIPIDDMKRLLDSQNREDLADAINALKEAREKGTIALDEIDETR
jgi:prevent-host-death family protein